MRLAGWSALTLLLVALAAGGWLRHALVASLPQVEGTRGLPGLQAEVRIERDGLGTPTIRGKSRLDVARATGFVHAQERFFQMDLLRRRAAGELSEIVGPATLKADREIRIHRLRNVARAVVAAAPAADRALVQAYTDGVNAGLAALGEKPFEYLVLRAQPAPWQLEDTVLVTLAMFMTLQDSKGARESTLGVLYDVLPAPLADFLAPRGTEWDAPLVGDAYAQPPVPGPEVVDLRGTRPPDLPEEQPGGIGEASLGSNNWAVAGRLTAHGGAIVANDMHLDLGVPNVWFRVSLAWPEGGEERRVTGVSLPGSPAIVAGSNGHVAWGFTNSYGDWSDLVVLEADPNDPSRYLTPEGWRQIEKVHERIRVKGGADEDLEVATTIWGPILDRDHHGRQRALRWTAQDQHAVNLGMLRMESPRSAREALEVANTVGAPAQNFVCGDAEGHIGWTILGIIPRRVGFDGRLPTSWADGTRRWDGWLEPSEYPRILDPVEGHLWTANARAGSDAMVHAIGDGGYPLGARAGQIRDDLRVLDRTKATEADMLRIQLDDRALFLARWRELLLATLTPEAVADHPERARLKQLVEAWSGHAAVGDAGYRFVRGFRATLARQALGALTAGCPAADPHFRVGELNQVEGPLWALVTARPVHLLNPRYASWSEQILAAVDATAAVLGRRGALEARTWGERNMVRVRHPLSRALPWASGWLDMTPEALPGDSNMPLFQSPEAGASERLAVSPGHEASGLFHMPGGESGHPLSPHYRDGHAAWAHGAPTPFLPGPTVSTLRLVPLQ
jgi:penicillin amidase